MQNPASSEPQKSPFLGDRLDPPDCTKSHSSTGSVMMSGSQPPKLKLTFADAVVAAPTPEEKKA